MSPRGDSRFPRGRLVVRIYLFGFALALVSTVAISYFRFAARKPHIDTSIIEKGRLVITRLGELRHDRVKLEEEAKRVKDYAGSRLALYDASDALLVATVSPPPAPLDAERKRALARDGLLAWGGPPAVAVAIMDGSNLAAYGVCAPPFFGPPMPGNDAWSAALLLVLAGIASFFFARSLAKPLKRLAHVATAFGSGDLTVRARLTRRDELGALGKAFDEMADKVTGLLRAQKELLANVSHELRTPLSRIRVALDLATENREPLERESLAELRQDLAELERLVDDVLTSARLDLAEGRPGSPVSLLRPEPTDPQVILERSAVRFRAAHRGRKLELVTEGALPAVVADPTLLRRAVDNLLDNAHKYSDSLTPVTLLARPKADGIEVEVVDQGIGMTEADRAQVFDPFFRADRSRSRATGGVGLGLPLARRIVEAHGGSIAVESQLGRGTCVRFSIPGSAAASP